MAERILAVDPGNPSIVEAPQNRELRVYWKGTVPAKVKLIAQNAGVPVRFSPAAYTHSELVGISRRLVASQQAVGASAKADGSGVDASVLPGTKALARNKIQALAGVPVSVKTEPKLQDMIGRQADVPWFWGGSAVLHGVGRRMHQRVAGGAIGVGIMSAQMLGTATCFNSAPSGGAVVGSNRTWYAPLSRPPGPTLGALQRYNVGLILR